MSPMDETDSRHSQSVFQENIMNSKMTGHPRNSSVINTEQKRKEKRH